MSELAAGIPFFGDDHSRDFAEWEDEYMRHIRAAEQLGVVATGERTEIQGDSAKSFNLLASINMFRTDLREYGRVLPETRERVVDEELSLIAEGMNRAARTEFALKRIGDDLFYLKNGKWESYTAMLLTGRQVAISEAVSDPRKGFLADDAVRDLAYGLKMRSLQPGEHLAWASPYRQDIEDCYGAEFMKECGRFPHRKMAFLYFAFCEDNGNVRLQSQTIDLSDEHAINAALCTAASDTDATMDDMLYAHDGVLVKKHGDEFYAGRTDTEINENVWEELLRQQDLIEYFLTKLESIAALPLYGQALEEKVKMHTYGVWAALKKRIDGETSPPMYTQAPGVRVPVAYFASLEQEVSSALTDFARQGKAMIGCGGKIELLQGMDDIMKASPETVFESIFGKGIEDKYGSLTFQCPNRKCLRENRREWGRLRDKCQHCQVAIPRC